MIMGVVLNFLSLRGVFGSFDDAVFGFILIAIMLFAPNGILSLNWRGFFHKLFHRRSSADTIGRATDGAP
jgi:branched-chain amino acid transport system permease protein